jgi:hypothetical protein
MEEVRLDEFSKDEWYDICRRVQPGLTREDFDRMWDHFVQWKTEYQRKTQLN